MRQQKLSKSEALQPSVPDNLKNTAVEKERICAPDSRPLEVSGECVSYPKENAVCFARQSKERDDRTMTRSN